MAVPLSSSTPPLPFLVERMGLLVRVGDLGKRGFSWWKLRKLGVLFMVEVRNFGALMHVRSESNFVLTLVCHFPCVSLEIVSFSLYK